MGKIIEAKAVISAEDRTGRVFDQIARKFKEVGKGAKVAAEIDRMSKSLKGVQDNLRGLSDYQGKRSAFYTTRNDLTAARKAADEASRALTNAAKPTRQLQDAMRRTQKAVESTTQAFERQKAEVFAARRTLTQNGLSASGVIRQQAQLEKAADRTTRAIARQHALSKAEGGLAEGMSSAGRRQHAKIAQDRYLVDGMGSAGRSAMAERARAAQMSADEKAASRAERMDAYRALAGGAGLYLGHKVHSATHAVGHTYREFDKERRFAKVVMGLTDEEQQPLVDQAVHMGATTKYNDVQALESQRELAARGLNRDQVLGLMEPASKLGMSLDLKLPDAVKQMEGAIFGFKKDISTTAAATKSAMQTADLQVKAAKISGMSPEDISQVYKYGATPARMSGLSEQTLLAFGGISKKANMGGDEAGVAFRALVANALSPTRGAKEAMLANGMDYKNYQRMPDHIDTGAFTKTVAATYGVKLDKATQGGLDKIFSNKKLIADPSKFTPAVMDLLSDSLEGDDAKSKKSIAGLANRFRDKSMKGVDTDRFVQDLMGAISKNPALANSFFGSKQGGRIANALGDPGTWKHMMDELLHHSEGYSSKVSEERMKGYDGALSRLEGSVMNLQTATGRAWDDDGKGGFLTGLADAAAKATQALAELPRPVLQAGSALGYIGGKVATGAGTLALVGAAFSLKGSAAALTAAAGKLGLGGAAGSVAGKAAAEGAAGAAGAGLTLGGAITGGVILGGAAAGAYLDGNIGSATGSIGDLMNYRDKMHADDAAAASLGYGSSGRKMTMPGGIPGAAAGYATDYKVSRGAIGDFLMGPRKESMQLPGFGRDGSGQIGAINNTLDKAATASTTAANGGKPLEAKVMPDQITAQVKELPAISGQATVTVDQRTQVDVHVDADWIKATARAEAKSAVASIPLASSGARAGAVSMPGAAATPGAK